jgi:hypothetical protein
MTVFQGIFQSEGTLEGRGPQRHKLTAARTARSRFSVLVKGYVSVGQQCLENGLFSPFSAVALLLATSPSYPAPPRPAAALEVSDFQGSDLHSYLYHPILSQWEAISPSLQCGFLIFESCVAWLWRGYRFACKPYRA